eukprot:CAMPEP_0194371018 /NCGR_PEP_ID=MMETSP0174-20130528/19355_1 /TAXON_ID=216777 /ORGANISM="Proboscia alata, Strain PI-D3" /LENGTH=280 /DNA_ID=CAMNT_0039148799 /DNA_START=1319 /DNA_END=2157 /DNA_ORIENTATION=-
MANKLGNFSGLALVFFSIFVGVNSGSEENLQNEKQSLWSQPLNFYVGIASPCFLGLVASNIMATFLQLRKPERVTVSVECCYQNVGIATSVAITMFKGDELQRAIGVPIFYGVAEAVIVGLYCVLAWKFGWTKAPKNEALCVVVNTSYEIQECKLRELNEIEVVLGRLPSDIVVHHDEPSISKKSENSTKGSIVSKLTSIFTNSAKQNKFKKSEIANKFSNSAVAVKNYLNSSAKKLDVSHELHFEESGCIQLHISYNFPTPESCSHKTVNVEHIKIDLG